MISLLLDTADNAIVANRSFSNDASVVSVAVTGMADGLMVGAAAAVDVLGIGVVVVIGVFCIVLSPNSSTVTLYVFFGVKLIVLRLLAECC